MTGAPGNHDDRSATRPVDHLGAEHPRATAADAARTLAGSRHLAEVRRELVAQTQRARAELHVTERAR